MQGNKAGGGSKTTTEKPTAPPTDDRGHKLKHHDHGSKHLVDKKHVDKPKAAKNSKDDKIAEELLHQMETEKKIKHLHLHHTPATGAVH